MTDNVNVVVTTNDDSNSEKANYNYELLFQKDNTSIFGDNLPTSILQIEAESTSRIIPLYSLIIYLLQYFR